MPAYTRSAIAVVLLAVSLAAVLTAGTSAAAATASLTVPVNPRTERSADVYIQRSSPTSSPVGGAVTVHASGSCEDQFGAQFLDAAGTVLSSSPGTAVSDSGGGRPSGQVEDLFRSYTAMVRAPQTPGRYRLAATCGADRGSEQPYEVFAPTKLAATEPVPTEPTSGPPSAESPETYHGRIGPIALQEPSTQDPSGVSIAALVADLPRPPGDLGITGVHIALVDADGTPISSDRAEIGYFLTGNLGKSNPACPEGTFGVPSQIVSANNSRNPDLTLDDPYAMVIRSADAFGGSYELNGLSGPGEEVYIAYDIDFRRDLDNIRPLTSYFGSATGCSSPTYSLDGSGIADIQSHYISIVADALLVTAVGTVGDGGLYADLTDDRGRLLCHSEGLDSCGLREQLRSGEGLRFDAAYANDQPRSSVRGIFEFFVWEGGTAGPSPSNPGRPTAPAALPVPGSARFTG